MNKKMWYAICMGALILISACGKGKQGFMLFPPDAIKDSNGVPLPDDSSGNPGGNVQQEIPNHGPVQISGTLSVETPGGEIVSLTDAGLTAMDINNIKIKLIAPDASQKAEVIPEVNGNFLFDLADLVNNNYRILINDGYGLAYAYTDFNFVYDPTQNPNLISGLQLIAKRVYYTSGPAIISGVVSNPGFNQDGVNIPSGGLGGIEVCLYDSDNNQIACETTGSDGSFSFDRNDNSALGDLQNGNYYVVVNGESLTISGQNFSNAQVMVHFVFSGNNPHTPTHVSAGQLNVVWQAPTTGNAQIRAVVVNGAIEGDDLSDFTVKLFDENGNQVETATPNSSGLVEFSGLTLSNGIYYLQVSREGFNPRNQTFTFVAHAAGGTRIIDLTSQPIVMVANPSQVTGMISSGLIAPVPGARINFRPDQSQPPKNLAYLLEDPIIGNLIRTWILQACPTWNGTAAGTLSCNCAPNCNYQTWAIKEYDYNPSINKLVLTAVAGKWAYYVSAPGYENSAQDVIILNGQNEERYVSLSSSTRRSRIKGVAVTLDTLVNGQKNAYPMATGYTSRHPLPGLFVVLVTINDGTNNYALVTTTDTTGSYDFNGNVKVVQLPNGLTEEQKVGYAIQNFASAPTLADSSIVGTDPSATIQKVTVSGVDYYFLKQGAYSVFIVDPLDHISTGVYQADNSSVAVNVLDPAAVLNLTSILAHKPRRILSGNVTDAFTTIAAQGATVKLRKRVSGNLVQVYKDYDIISTLTRLNPSAHELVADQTTNTSGYYEFKNIDPGDYVLIISKTGYEDQIIDVTVPWNGNATVNTTIVPNTGRGDLDGRVLLAGGHPFTGTYAIELVNPVSGVRPTSGINPASLTTGPAVWSGTSQYNIFSVNAGQWKVKFTAAGYKSVEGLVNIPANGKAVFDIITAIPDSQGPANIRGVVRNAFNNKPVSGLTVRIRPGINITSGPYALNASNQTIPAVTTDSNGNYVITNVPAGNYTLEVSGTGTANGITEPYITTYKTVISAGTNTPASQDVLISPQLGPTEMRIVLQWNTNNPSDLDSHFEFGNKNCRIQGTLPNKHTCQVYWKWKKVTSERDSSFSGLNRGDGSLDYDVVTGYGPETITVKNTMWSFIGPNANRYGYGVFNWSQRYFGGRTIKDAQAVVRVYKHTGLVRTYVAGSGQINLWWNLFCIDKTTKAIIDVGQPGCSATDFINDPGVWDYYCDNNNPSDTRCYY